MLASVTALCETAWVPRSSYGFSARQIREALATLLDYSALVTDRRVAASGLAFLDAGADFADGVIAAEGYALGGERFVSFDRRAVAAAASLGIDARTP